MSLCFCAHQSRKILFTKKITYSLLYGRPKKYDIFKIKDRKYLQKYWCSSGCECLCKDPFLRLQNVQSCDSCAVWGLKCEVCTDHKCNIETWCRVDIRTLEHFTSCNKTLTRGPEPSELELIRPGVRRRISLGSSIVTLAHLHTLHIQHTGGQVSYFCNFYLQNVIVMVEMNRKVIENISMCKSSQTTGDRGGVIECFEERENVWSCVF